MTVPEREMTAFEKSKLNGRDEGALAVNLLRALWRAVGTFRLYPDPTSQPGLIASIEAIRESLTSGIVRVKVSRDRFSVADDDLAEDDSLRTLAAALYERGVIEIHFRSAPEARELAAFAELIAEDALAVEGTGGARTFLERRGVLAIGLTTRDLQITAKQRQRPTRLPEKILSLLQDHSGLARQIESEYSPAEAMAFLQELVQEGLMIDLGLTELYAHVGDTIAAMVPDYRSQLVELAIEGLPAAFPSAVTGQLSDGELAEALMTAVSTRGVEETIAFARRVVTHSPGRRDELPLLVGNRLRDQGYDEKLVFQLLEMPDVQVGYQEGEGTGGLSLSSAESPPDFVELRLEASVPGGKAEIADGIVTLRALMRSDVTAEDFQGLIEFSEVSVRQGVREGNAHRSLALLEALIEEAGVHPDPDRKARLEQAARSAVSPDLVSKLLEPGAAEDRETSLRLLSLIREWSVPALLEQLAEETDRTKRKVLVDMLTQVAHRETGLFYAALQDDRWYFVRNVVAILGKTGSRDAIKHVRPLIRHSEPRVRREAVRAAAAAGGPEAIAAVVEVLEDADEGVQLSAIAALGMIQHPEAARALIDIVKGRRAHSVRARKEALTSLSLHKDSASSDFLRRTAHRKWPPRESTRQLSKRAQELLERADERPAS